MTAAAAVVVALIAAGLQSEVDTSEFRYTRALSVGQSGSVVFEPDGAMYAHSRVGFPDLRILDARDTQVPWRTPPIPEAIPPQPVELVARGRLDDVVSVVADRGPAPEAIDRIELEIPDREFVGEAEVLGSNTGTEGSYATLSTTQIYSVRGAVDARSTTAVFPATDYRYLLVRASGVSDITGATVARVSEAPPLETVTSSERRRDRARTTVVRLDLGFAKVPVDAVRIESTTDSFVRRVTVEGSNDGRTFVLLGAREIARFRGVDLDRIDVEARHRYLRVTIENGDDVPLAGLRVSAQARPRPLLLADGHERPFRLFYGAQDVAAPSYDFARLPAAETGFEEAQEGSLGPEELNDSFAAPEDERTFFEKNERAVEVLLVLAALVVAAGGFLALRRRT